MCARYRSAAPLLIIPLLLLAPPSSPAADDQGNLVVNPSFEQPARNSPLPAGWHGEAQVFQRDAKAGRNGSAALRYVNNDPARYSLAMQTISLQPGRRYRLSGWVKTEKVAGADTGATFCIEWSDKAGKWMGGMYPTGVKGTRDWTQISDVAAIPANAGSCSLSCYVRPGMTGTAWFDDISVVRVVEPALRSVLTAPVYRGRITADGPRLIRARVWVDLRDHDVQAQDVQVTGRLSGVADGKPHGVVTQQPKTDQGTIAPLTLELPTDRLPTGDYRLDIELVRTGGRVISTVSHRLTRLADNDQPKCTIDEHRRLLVDGKPFFPLGMYWTDIQENDLKLYAESKFNCLMPYGSPSRPQMDLAHKHGLKVIYSLKHWYAGSPECPPFIRSAADEEPLIRGRVREMRDHPALLAWYLNDELPQRFLAQLEAHQRWVAEEDRDHPTWVALYQVNEVGSYLNTFDVIGTDPYPIPRSPASMAAAWTATTFREVEGARPMWQVPQLHNWANYARSEKERKQGRTPTTEEVRSMAWQCITEGATGLVFYSWFDVKQNPDVPFDKQWSGLKELAAEIDRMAPMILSTDPVPQPGVKVNDGRPPAWLHWLARSHRGSLYLFAVNDGDGAGRITFRLPGAAARVRELSTNTIVPHDGPNFTVQLDRLEVRLYQIELR